MNQLNAYLFFDGTCADAMRFYEGALGGKLDLITHAQSPTAGSTPAGNAGRIMPIASACAPTASARPGWSTAR